MNNAQATTPHSSDLVRPAPLPPPSDIPGNDWRLLAAEPLEDFRPHLSVSVVVPYYEAPDELRRTLTALEQQRYPRELFDVVVVDDGSKQPCERPADIDLDLKIVHQEDLGFGLARARNTGVRNSSGDVLVFLDCDMMPERDWLASHARWHHAASDVLTLGFRAHVDVVGIEVDDIRGRSGTLGDLFSGRAVDRPEWIEFHMVRTDELTSNADDLFRVVTGGNLGVGRDFFDLVGGFDESFTQWGCEDIEFGYRAFTRGAVLVPARSAMCWHQGPGAAPDEAEAASLELQRAKISQLIAHHGFRQAKAGRSFAVPQHVVVVEAGVVDADTLLATVESVLASDVHDLVVWVEEPAGALAPESSDTAQSREFERFRRLVSGDPRVRIGPVGGALDAIPAAAFIVRLWVGAPITGNEITRLRSSLGTGATASIPLKDGTSMTIARTRWLHRAQRTGRVPSDGPVAEHGGTAEAPRSAAAASSATVSQQVAPAALPPAESETSLAPPLGRYRKAARMLSLMMREALRVRSVGDARRVARSFLGYAGRAAGWRIRWVAWKCRTGLRRALWGIRRAPSRWRGARDARRPVNKATYRLRPTIAASGPRAAAVFAASARVDTEAGPSTQLMLVDSKDVSAPSRFDGLSKNVPHLFLEDLDGICRVPAFDAEQVNPQNLPYRSKRGAAALGPKAALPARLRVSRTIAADRPMGARRYRCVVDVDSYHKDRRERAGALVACAAAGALVYVADPEAGTAAGAEAGLDGSLSGEAQRGESLRALLGDPLFELMTDERVLVAVDAEREALGVAMRREALRTHSLRARARQVAAGTNLAVDALPAVSILLATRRPQRLASACAAIASQTYPHIEVVLALHGDGFDEGEQERCRAAIPFDSQTVLVDASEPLGAVLNAAVAASTGALLTKFDDDDFYGPEHIWDLVLAHEYSRAALVGKAAEFVYLEQSGRTIRRFGGGSERLGSDLSLAGGAMLVSRHDLAAAGGWQPIPAGVDQALMADIVGIGRRTYRTHGFGYMLVRHGGAHTWDVGDDYFVNQAGIIRDGCDLEFAGVVS